MIMNKAVIKDLIYGGIRELQQNSNFYYSSVVGVEYSHWTESGMLALHALVQNLSVEIDRCERQIKQKNSEEYLLKELGKHHV